MNNYMIGSTNRFMHWKWFTFLNLINEGKIEEAKLFNKKMYVDLYDNWGVLILNKEMTDLLKTRWESIHLNHSEKTLFCSDPKCPKFKMIVGDEMYYD